MAQTPTQKAAGRPRERAGEQPSPRPRVQIRPATKEFDLRAAHKEWKERNGLDVDDPW